MIIAAGYVLSYERKKNCVLHYTKTNIPIFGHLNRSGTFFECPSHTHKSSNPIKQYSNIHRINIQ